MITLESEAAYRLWAPTYNDETAITLLENDIALDLSPPLAGKRLLDAGCGTGRRLEGQRAALAVGVDGCREMLKVGGGHRVVVADIRALPLPSGSFDVVWCRLVLGHIHDPKPAYCELARVCRPGGKLLVSDFHTEAVAAGHSRSFRDKFGQRYAVEHHVHDVVSHREAAQEAGFSMTQQCEGKIGERVKHMYVMAGRSARYEKDIGLPVVAAFLFERMGNAAAD